MAQTVKNSPAMGDLGSIPGLERSPRGGHGSQLQYSCLENPMDRGAWCATVQESQSRIRYKGQGAEGHASFVKDQVVNIFRRCRPHTVSATYSLIL